MAAQRAVVLAHLGRTEEARLLLQRLTTSSPRLGEFQRAVIHLALGERDEALNLLERAAEQRSPFLRLIKVEPTFAPLHGDPRFAELVRRAGLAPPIQASRDSF